MKTKKRALFQKKRILNQKLSPWIQLRGQEIPNGWLRHMRSALGMTTRILASRMNISQSTLVALESREEIGNVTISNLKKAAEAMDCELIYAMIPKAPSINLDDILEKRGKIAARKLVESVNHSMALENQKVSKREIEAQIEELSREMIKDFDPRLWDES